MDLQYHDLRPDKSLAARVGLERIAGADEIDAAMTQPPPDTRAYFRGRCLSRWPESIVAANWDSLVFDVGGDPLRRVPMMERSEEHTSELQSLMRISYAVFCLNKKTTKRTKINHMK